MVHPLSSVSVGVDTSVTDSVPNGRGKLLHKGDIVSLDMVIRVGEKGFQIKLIPMWWVKTVNSRK